MNNMHNPWIIGKNQNNPHLTFNSKEVNIKKVSIFIIHGLLLQKSEDYYPYTRSFKPHRVQCETKDHLHRNVTPIFMGFFSFEKNSLIPLWQVVHWIVRNIDTKLQLSSTKAAVKHWTVLPHRHQRKKKTICRAGNSCQIWLEEDS